MLKKLRVLFLGLMVLAGSACVTPTHASSAQDIILTTIQAAGEGGAKDEFIAIHNNSPLEVEVTDWCVVSKGSVAIVCFNQALETTTHTRYFLPAYSSATIVSKEHVAQSGLTESAFSFVYEVFNQSSGSIVGSSATVALINNENEIVDEKGWSTAAPSGKIWSRRITNTDPKIYANTDIASDWVYINRGVFVESSLVTIIEQPPVDEPEVPGDTETPGGNGDVELPVRITEILPNPEGADADKEFIEIFNPNDTKQVSLNGLRIRVGIDSFKWYDLPSGITLGPLQYYALYNSEVAFTLANAAGAVRLYHGDNPIGEVVTYTAPKDGQSWMLLDGVWSYSLTPSPNKLNVVSSLLEDEISAKEATAKPCASNQYRSEETGRCRLIATATAGPAPCKVGQERNPETGRCRNITTQTTPSACKAGQERNPETNRCRNIVKMSSAGNEVKGVQMKADNRPSWYFVITIILVVAAILAYAVWEWRQELGRLWQRVREKFVKRTD